MTTIHLPIEPQAFCLALGLVAVSATCGLILWLFWVAQKHKKIGAGRLQNALGLKDLPVGVFWLAVVAWGWLTVVLFPGLFIMVLDTIFWRDGSGSALDFRWHVARLAALTTVLGAVVALPITLNRLRLTREANDTAAESLFNEKFAQASGDLYAQRQVTKRADSSKRHYTVWQDDIPRRNAAIDRLEGLVKERPSEAERVSRLLSVYVRELSREHPPEPGPATSDIQEIRKWAKGLQPIRSDMENAVQVLGRLAHINGVEISSLCVDLSGCNLQGFNLNGGGPDAPTVFPKGTKLNRASLQGSKLRHAKLQGTNLDDAQLQGADLFSVELQKSKYFMNLDLAASYAAYLDLNGSIIRDLVLFGATARGIDLRGAEISSLDLCQANLSDTTRLDGALVDTLIMDEKTVVGGITATGMAVCHADFESLRRLQAHWHKIFVHWRVDLLDETLRPNHWPVEKDGDFETQWRAWQRSIGMNPDGSMRTP